MKEKKNFGFVRGAYSPYLMVRDLDLFWACDNLNVITVLPERLSQSENRPYRQVTVKKILPDFISDIFFRQPYSPVSFIKLDRLEEQLKDVDVINTMELYSFISSQCASIARKLNKRLVVNVLETIPDLPLHYLPPHSWNVKAVIRQADLFLAYTEKTAEYLKALSIPEEKIETVYPVIDLKRFSPDENLEPHQPFRILFNSRLAPEKGFKYLLQAFLKLLSEKRDLEIWICADYKKSVEGTNLYDLVQERNYPIKFFGWLNYNELPNIYRACDLLCLPSIDRYKFGAKVWEEQFGYVLAEGMAAGLPIVASDCGAIPEVVGSDNIIVRQKSVDDLYAAIKKLLTNPNLGKKIGKSNLKRAGKMFNVENQRNQFQQMLAKTLRVPQK